MKLRYWIILLAFLITKYAYAQQAVNISFSIDNVFNIAKKKYLKSSEVLSIHNGFPRSAQADGSWDQRPAEDWTSGFYPGTLWYIYEGTNDWRIKEAAIEWTEALQEIQYMYHHHDIGFMMYCSYGNGLRLINKPAYKDILIQSARTLSARFNPKVGTLRSWDWPGEPESHPVIIDNMMNLELLLWASNNCDDPIFRNIAISHADTTLKYHFRNDGSSYHLVLYNGVKGGVSEKRTVQGYALESSWARGQTWGMYGFTYMYQHTGKLEYLALAEKTSQLFIERLPQDVIPYWDFDAPNIPDEPKDASSAGLAASALLSLFEVTNKQEYYNAAVRLLNALTNEAYLNKDEDFGGLIKHSTGAKPANSEVDVHLNYADYYYLEALLKLKQIKKTRIKNAKNKA